MMIESGDGYKLSPCLEFVFILLSLRLKKALAVETRQVNRSHNHVK